MRHRPTSVDHQAGSLLPELRGVLPTLARHTDNLPAGPAVLPVRCPPSGFNPSTMVCLEDGAALLICNVALPARVFTPRRQPTNRSAARGLRPQLAPIPTCV